MNKFIENIFISFAISVVAVMFFIGCGKESVKSSMTTEKDFQSNQIQEIADAMKKQKYSFVKMSPSEIFLDNELNFNIPDCKELGLDRENFEDYVIYYSNDNIEIEFPLGIQKCISSYVLTNRVVKAINSIKSENLELEMIQRQNKNSYKTQ